MYQTAANPNRSLLVKYGVPLEHLDFEYVSNCNDPKELKHIIQILESGEEGHYPKLIAAAENQLRNIKPDATILNRKPSYALKSSDLLNSGVQDDVIDDIAKWIQKSKDEEQKLSQNIKPVSLTNGHDEIPVRRSINFCTMFNSEKVEHESIAPKKLSVKNWDNYDPEVEIMKMENKEKIDKLQSLRNKKIVSNVLSLGGNDRSDLQDRVKSMKPLIQSLSKDSTVSIQQQALREKELGNEFFYANDFEEAIRYYNTSIGIYPTPEARNNRAMSYIKLERYDQALNDLREVIQRDPKNIKAHFRRGSCLKSISMFCLALRSFEMTLKYDCNNLKAIQFVKELKNLISNIPKQNLIRVREITRHYDQTVWDIEDPFFISYSELKELNKEQTEYIYEANTMGCLTECICNLCPYHEWMQRRKKWYRNKIIKNEQQRKRWQLLTPEAVVTLMSESKSKLHDTKVPKRMTVTEVNSTEMNGHISSTVVNHNGLMNGSGDKSSCNHCKLDVMKTKPVSSVHDFLLRWKTANQKNNFDLYNKLLRSIKPKNLPKVISTNLDEEIMSKFFETLCQKFDPDSELDLIAEYVIAMTKVDRFNLIVKMLDNKVKESFRPLLKRVHNHTKNQTFLTLL
ncbi:RNA polymerase II-associated protein 3 [Daktulosphaira vitifoliae]|uniref:RNA polymerase II-associated protein 3 n=1 Tax=Daktulosphaira vitifoliae TaxID=58002 RepID=UPI0021A9D1B9|nr:RNA polymerase II-associated protein 3 [Daktulosphaira vitifoliae]